VSILAVRRKAFPQTRIGNLASVSQGFLIELAYCEAKSNVGPLAKAPRDRQRLDMLNDFIFHVLP
jgi:hypothetical protein